MSKKEFTDLVLYTSGEGTEDKPLSDNFQIVDLEGHGDLPRHSFINMKLVGDHPYDDTSICLESDGEGGLIMWRQTGISLGEGEHDLIDYDIEVEKVMHIPADWLTQDPDVLKKYIKDDGKKNYDEWLCSDHGIDKDSIIKNLSLKIKAMEKKHASLVLDYEMKIAQFRETLSRRIT